MSTPSAGPAAAGHRSTRTDDQEALGEVRDWSHLRSLEQLWPELEQIEGDAIALDAPHARPAERLSFRELRHRIEAAAAAFAQLGVRPGEVVALFAENGPRWLVADQGLMRAGAADAVRGSGAPVEELRFILRDSGAVGLVVESLELLGRLAEAAGTLADLRFVVLLEDHPGDAGTDEIDGVPCVAWQELIRRGGDSPPPAAPPQEGDRIATLLYTSGTTGQPKGVPLTHANLLHQVRTLGVAVQPRPGDQVVSVLPIWHAYERTAEYFLLACGCRQTYTTLRHLRHDLQAVRPQYLISVPRLWEALLSGFEDALTKMPAPRRHLLEKALANSRRHCRSRRTAEDLILRPVPALERLAAAVEAALRWPAHRLAGWLLWPKVRSQLVGGRMTTAISGGGALAIHVDGFFEAIGIELLVGYGLTETSPVLTCRRRWINRRGSSGLPLPDTEVRIVDPGSGLPLGPGKRGVVQARGPQVMGGYHHRPEATAKVLDAEGWFDTGDLGHLLDDGCLVLTGRAKDTIVLSSGENIEPGPLEEALVASPLLEQVMLVGQDRRQLGALVVPRQEAIEAFALQAGLAASDPALPRALTRECNRILAERTGARPDERLAGIALVEPFTLENGLLTQTLKQRRDRISERDGAAIEAIYASR